MYVFPVVRPETVNGEAAPDCEPVTPRLIDVHVAVNEVTGLPLPAPPVKETTSDPVVVAVEPETTVTAVGAAGAPTMAAADGADARPSPRAFVAVTVQVYVFPVVRLGTVSGEAAPVWVPVAPPSLDAQVAVNAEIALPLSAPAVNDTMSDPVARVVGLGTAFTPVGADGAPTVTTDEAADVVPAPATFTAVTRNWYVPAGSRTTAARAGAEPPTASPRFGACRLLPISFALSPRFTVSPRSSSPWLLPPQHFDVPSSKRAHE